MTIATLISALVLTINGTLAGNIKTDSNFNYQTYQPNTNINMEIYQADRDGAGSEYRFGVIMYYLSDEDTYDVYRINNWELKIKANDIVIYETGDNEHILNVYGGIMDIAGNGNAYISNNAGTSLRYMHKCSIDGKPYLFIDEALKYSMNGRSNFESSTSTSNIAISIEFKADEVPILGKWCFNLGTFKVHDYQDDFTYASQINYSIYAANNTYDSIGLTSYSIKTLYKESPSAENLTNISTSSTYYVYAGISDTNTNRFNNYTIRNRNSFDDDSQHAATLSIRSNQYQTFDINRGEYLYQASNITYRVPSRCYIVKDARLYNGIWTANLFNVEIQCVYTDFITGGAPIGGGAGSNDNLTIECSGGLLANFACYMNNTVGSIITQGPLFKPLMNFIDKFYDIIDMIKIPFFKILDILKTEVY